MESALDVIFLTVVATVALVAVVLGANALRPVLQLRQRKSSRAAELTPGPCEIAGRVRAVGEPLRGFGGEPLAAALWRVSYSYRSGNKTHRTELAEPIVRGGPLEIVDSTGACGVGLHQVILVGPESRLTLMPDAFANLYPEVWAKIESQLLAKTISAVHVTETIVPHDAEGVVSGHAIPEDVLVPSGDYRGAKQRMRIVGTEEIPMLLSGWPEPQTQRYLRGPSVLLFLHAFIVLAAAIGYWIARSAIHALG